MKRYWAPQLFDQDLSRIYVTAQPYVAVVKHADVVRKVKAMRCTPESDEYLKGYNVALDHLLDWLQQRGK